MESRVALLTVSVWAVLVTVPRAAVIWVAPAATPEARPREPETLEMVATVVDEEAQVTVLVRSWVEASE